MVGEFLSIPSPALSPPFVPSRILDLVLALLAFGAGLLPLSAYDIPGFPPDRIATYKETFDSQGNPVTLDLHLFTPPGHLASDSRPAIVFFFGGGWNSGSPGQFHPHCDYLASRGMVAISAEYRVNSTHGTSPQECIKDGKSAIRWVRENAAMLGIDPARIAAGGGPAGGHIAAAAGTLAAYDEPDENLDISSRPDALVLYNPVYDNGPGGYGHSRVLDDWEDFSPLHNIDATIPPAVVFLGTSDSLIPVSTAVTFQSLMAAAGVRSDLHLYHEQPHSFFNYDLEGDSRGPYLGFQDTLFKTDRFLTSLGYLEDDSLPRVPVTGWTTLFGTHEFLSGSEAGPSPVTTRAGASAIAAAFPEVSLSDGDFIRLSGSVKLDVPLTAGNFRFGLFAQEAVLSPGDGTGYRGIWAGVPDSTSQIIATGNGIGMAHPFESEFASPLGPVPAAASQVAANTPLSFTLMIARFGDFYDLALDLTDGATFQSSQNLLHQNLNTTNFNRVAFFMRDDLGGSQASFENVALSRGPLLRLPQPLPVIERTLTYLDAVEGPEGNTFATGSPASDTSWVLAPGTSAANETQWSKRAFGNGGTIFQGLHTLPDTLPKLTTRISGLDGGSYEVWAFYWDQIDSDTQNWTLSAALAPGPLESYSSPGEPSVAGATINQVQNANDLAFTSEVLTTDGDGLRHLFGIKLGQVTIASGERIEVLVANLLGNGSNNRSWFDGVGYAKVNDYLSWIAPFNLGPHDQPGDDPDDDGLPNSLENIFATHPGLPDQAALNVVRFNGIQATITHPLNAEAAEDLVVRYQWSEDLESFHDDGETNSNGTSVTFERQPAPLRPGFVSIHATRSGPALARPLFFRVAVTPAFR
jgi:acetyl esterase/lipase